MAAMDRHLPRFSARHRRLGAGSLGSRPGLSRGATLRGGAVRERRRRAGHERKPQGRGESVMKKQVVIVGGGFGGLRAARALKSAPVDVTLIDRRNYHLFQPLLYQVATGSLSPGQIAAPLRSVLSRQKNTRVLMGEVVDLDPVARRIVLADGATFEYDSLIVAAGSQTSYYGHDLWREWAPGMKSVEEATNIRHKILYAFEVAERLTDPVQRRAWLRFVIVGAGATGVELAGAIGEIARQTLKNDFRSIRSQDAEIILLDGAPRVLMAFPEDLAQKAAASLARLGVHVKTGVMVKDIDHDGVTVESHTGTDRLESKTVIWAGGVTAPALGHTLATRTKAETDRGGRIKVNPDLTVPSYPDIYVVGDLALASDRSGKPLPGVAQVAMQGGTYAAKGIVRKLEGGKPPSPTPSASISPGCPPGSSGRSSISCTSSSSAVASPCSSSGPSRT